MTRFYNQLENAKGEENVYIFKQHVFDFNIAQNTKFKSPLKHKHKAINIINMRRGKVCVN